jgi:hypothetical protein
MCDEAKFHDIERTYERILYIICIEKRDFDEVAEVMF